MDRFWLLSNTCYGNWLPGDARGFVGQVWDHRSDDPKQKPRVRHSLPSTAYDRDSWGLRDKSLSLMKGPPIRLTQERANVLLAQFRETAEFRHWSIQAAAIMFNHFHLVVGVPGDPSPARILGDFKSWGTRRLSAQFGEPASKTWWTERGSKRKLPTAEAVRDAVHYVLYHQPNPLVTWSPDSGSE